MHRPRHFGNEEALTRVSCPVWTPCRTMSDHANVLPSGEIRSGLRIALSLSLPGFHRGQEHGAAAAGRATKTTVQSPTSEAARRFTVPRLSASADLLEQVAEALVELLGVHVAQDRGRVHADRRRRRGAGDPGLELAAAVRGRPV